MFPQVPNLFVQQLHVLPYFLDGRLSLVTIAKINPFDLKVQCPKVRSINSPSDSMLPVLSSNIRAYYVLIDIGHRETDHAFVAQIQFVHRCPFGQEVVVGIVKVQEMVSLLQNSLFASNILLYSRSKYYDLLYIMHFVVQTMLF